MESLVDGSCGIDLDRESLGGMFRKRGSSIVDLLAGRLASVVAYAFDL